MASTKLDKTLGATVAGASGELRIGAYILGPRLGAGGMGMVFAGHEANSGRKVAIKLMRADAAGQAGRARFGREAVTLSGLRHPAIVEYIDHGITGDGHAYLVMEWLVGEDLQDRLKRGPLSIAEGVAFAARIADALAEAHKIGVIHRDIKPSNIFLPGGAISNAKLLDFGVARVDMAENPLTRTGAMIGTIGYMAPEQARGEPDLDGRADLYSLGCVLFECLAGSTPFTGEHPMAVLAKILLDDTPRLRSVRPDVPPELDELVASLLSKVREERPRDAKLLALRLIGLPKTVSDDTCRGPTPEAQGVTLREQRVFSLLLMRLSQPVVDPLASTSIDDFDYTDIVQTAKAFGASFSPLLGGFGVASVQLDAPAGDVAMQVARCALAIRRLRPRAAQVLVTGRALRQGTSFVGRVIEDAISLERHTQGGTILVDSATAELLTEAFVIEHEREHLILSKERETISVRTLLGRPSPFVGRVRELAWLQGIVREVIDESHSCVALVTAGPGVGKSRLRAELIRTLSQEGLDLLILLGRGHPMTRGSALGLIRSAIRREVGIADGATAEQQNAKLCERVAMRVSPEECNRISAFLGEMCGLHLENEHHPSLSLAREDASVMADCTRIAWVDWLRAECRQRPVLLVLEDLHWGDAASVAYVESALKNLSDLPFFVLALARPDVYTQFPLLWSDNRLTTLELPPISARAGEMMARQVLGSAAAEHLISRIVAHSEGNPFFLEELLRAATSGSVDQLPDTVLGVVQARLRALDDESRRLMRAASVFGGAFTEGGLAQIIGQSIEFIRPRLSVLVHQEFFSREQGPGALKYRFRHALLRDASYAMFLDDDRRLAHRIAAEWLSNQEEYEPTAVAKHYLDAVMPEEAQEWFRRAAEQALEGGDFAAAVERAEQAVACGATGKYLAELRLLQVEARIWAGSLTDIEEWVLEAVGGLIRGSHRWFCAVQRSIYCAGLRGDIDSVLTRLATAEEVDSLEVVRDGKVLCLCEAMNAVYYVGTPIQMESLAQRLEFLLLGTNFSRAVMGYVERARSTAFGMFGNIGRAAEAAAKAVECFSAAGDFRNAGRVGVIEGLCMTQLGALDLAENALKAVETSAARLGIEQTLLPCRVVLGEVLMRSGRLEQAYEIFLNLLDAVERRREPRVEGSVCIYLGHIALERGDLEAAERYFQRGLSKFSGQSTFEIWGLASLARARLLRGQGPEAGELALRALGMTDSGHVIHQEGKTWLMIIECLKHVDTKHHALAMSRAITWMRTRLRDISQPRYRDTFLALPECRALCVFALDHGCGSDELGLPDGRGELAR